MVSGKSKSRGSGRRCSGRPARRRPGDRTGRGFRRPGVRGGQVYADDRSTGAAPVLAQGKYLSCTAGSRTAPGRPSPTCSAATGRPLKSLSAARRVRPGQRQFPLPCSRPLSIGARHTRRKEAAMTKGQISLLFVCSLVFWTTGNGLLPLLPLYAGQLGARARPSSLLLRPHLRRPRGGTLPAAGYRIGSSTARHCSWWMGAW